MSKCEERLGFTKGKFSACLKNELRKCINKNLIIKNAARISKSIVRKKLEDAVASINEKEKSLAEHPDKNKIMLKVYLRTLDTLTEEFRNLAKEGK